MGSVTKIVIIGGGPGGYEAALVAQQLGADVTVVDRDGLGGAAVLTDAVPSKTLIATAEVMALLATSGELGIRSPADGAPSAGPEAALGVNLRVVNARVKALAMAQSADIGRRLEAEGVRLVRGRGRLDGPRRVSVDGAGTLDADTVLIAVGASPRTLPDAVPDGER